MTAQLSAESLTLFRGDRCLFRDVSFALNAGELLILEGSNGSGKTSLMRAIVGMLDLEAGVVRWNGKPVSEQRQVFHGALVWTAHRVALKADLTPVENLRYEAALRRLSTLVMEDSRNIGPSIQVTLALRALERIGGHAKNIAGYLVYLATGTDVRHRDRAEVEALAGRGT